QEALHIEEAMGEVTDGNRRESLVIWAAGLARGGAGADAGFFEEGMGFWGQGAGSIPSSCINSVARACSSAVGAVVASVVDGLAWGMAADGVGCSTAGARRARGWKVAPERWLAVA
ncbi:MAG: hypothetical protein VKM17_05990, partial [Cyanobacteriota bacterium]|nr:hypothetical protein [Cyanobacteriota bacterium]